MSNKVYLIKTGPAGPEYVTVGRDEAEARLALPPRLGRPLSVRRWEGALSGDLEATVPFNRLGVKFNLTLSEMLNRRILMI